MTKSLSPENGKFSLSGRILFGRDSMISVRNPINTLKNGARIQRPPPNTIEGQEKMRMFGDAIPALDQAELAETNRV